MDIRSLEDVTPATSEASGVEVRRLKRVEDVELKVFDVEPGSSTPFHTHPHAHEAVILSGSGTVRLEDGEQALTEGMCSPSLRTSRTSSTAMVGSGSDSSAWTASSSSEPARPVGALDEGGRPALRGPVRRRALRRCSTGRRRRGSPARARVLPVGQEVRTYSKELNVGLQVQRGIDSWGWI